ncbi:hypothetical protein R4P70_29805 [Rhodococcus sp. IEGM 1241]|uniref:hypothetical protein n=1 Tax=Rhodococcus sp. IEGM 1241 TaxID=3082228 RepID=UPI00295570A3|nr:hypothetical protein [Rhodococcus sp. IEGM 1241]MDV8015519.1 hypothetical protein [Rhodococcus sp. IEGM 1241]
MASRANAQIIPAPKNLMIESPGSVKVPVATISRRAAAVITRPVRSAPSLTVSSVEASL